ncbi:MAG: type II secretion system protein, partial [Magnetococcales bacterium]|nr:type II secretion system protein [Magnetococcales bacterium]
GRQRGACGRGETCGGGGEAGFTLLELILVMILVGILSYSLVYSSPTSAVELSNAADMLMMDYRQAQMLSIRNGGDYQLVPVTASSFKVVDGSGVAVKNTTDVSPITISSLNTITFDTLGVPSSSGTITFTGFQGSTITATVYSETGAILRD